MAIIQGFHTCAAHFGGPHWLMNDEDARTYAVAVNNALRHFDVEAAQKTIDITNAIGLACFFEGTRLLYSRMPAAQRAQQQPRPTGQVVPIFHFAPPAPAFAGAGSYPPMPPSAAPTPTEVYGPPNPAAPEGQVH